MNQRSLDFGIRITGWWLLLIVVFAIFGDLTFPQSLNELGDFLAGIFAPIAFFWLVLGYIQQAKQLEQNTQALKQQEQALRLQIEEMRQSVRQQKGIIEIQNQQYNMIKKSALPDFLIMIKDFRAQNINGIEECFFTIDCKNIGGEISDLVIITEQESTIILSSILCRGESVESRNFNTKEDVELYESDRCYVMKMRAFFKDVYKNEFLYLYHLELMFNYQNGCKSEVFVVDFKLVDDQYVM